MWCHFGFCCLYGLRCKGNNARMLGRSLNRVTADGREWSVNQLLFADDTAVMADSEERLRCIIKKLVKCINGRNLK